MGIFAPVRLDCLSVETESRVARTSFEAAIQYSSLVSAIRWPQRYKCVVTIAGVSVADVDAATKKAEALGARGNDSR